MKQLIRKENWPSLLKEFTLEYQDKDLVWGEYDCCIMVIQWIEKCTGINVCNFITGKYATKRGAYGKLKKFSDNGVVGAFEKIAEEFKMPHVHPQKVQRGDVVLLEGITDKTGGICVGRYILAFDLSRNKASYFPLESVIMAWRV